MNYREKEANPILFVLLLIILFLVLLSGLGVYFWLQSLRSLEMQNQVERAELRAKAEAIRMQQAVEESSSTEEATSGTR